MRLNFGKIFQEKSKDRSMEGLVKIPDDSSLWPQAWKTVQYKTYERFAKIILPAPMPKIFGHAELIKRRSTRDFGELNAETGKTEHARISFQQISNILFYSCGETKKIEGQNNSKRIQPSGGGRYPIEAYILNFEKGDLDIKCYHYNVQDHSLEALWEIPLSSRKDINQYFGYEWSTNASAAIVLTAVVSRTVMKYGERGYRYIYLEAGAIFNNIQNNSMLEGMGSVILGATNEKQMEKLLDLDGENESVIMGILLG